MHINVAMHFDSKGAGIVFRHLVWLEAGYVLVKAAVLKACELMPLILIIGVHYWGFILSMFCELSVLEQFKSSVPSDFTTYINDHKLKSATGAATLANEYVLTNCSDCECRAQDYVGYGGWQ